MVVGEEDEVLALPARGRNYQAVVAEKRRGGTDRLRAHVIDGSEHRCFDTERWKIRLGKPDNPINLDLDPMQRNGLGWWRRQLAPVECDLCQRAFPLDAGIEYRNAAARNPATATG